MLTSSLGGVVVEPEQYLAAAAAQAGIPDAEAIVVSDLSVVKGLEQVLGDVAEPVVCMSTHGRSGIAQAQSAIEFGAVHALAETLLSRDGAGINWDVMHRRDVSDAIVEFARAVPASFIAMATHGRSGVGRLALGSVAAAVVHDAPCPVLVVRPAGRADGDEAR